MAKDFSPIKQFIKYWIPVFLWMSLIYYFSSRSSLPGATTIIFWDFIMKKSAHMVIYAILFFLLQRAINQDRIERKYSIALLIAFLYAASDEYHQSFTAGRTALPTDVIFDMIGASMVYMRFRNVI